jgi:hypothetical protein
VRVTSPRTTARRSSRVTPASAIDAQTRVGEMYMASLLHTQLRLAARVLAVVGVAVAGLPLLFWLVPATVDARLLGVPLPWLLLGGAVYPFLLGCGWVYIRAAERNERAFASVVAPIEGEDSR